MIPVFLKLFRDILHYLIVRENSLSLIHEISLTPNSADKNTKNDKTALF